MKRVLLVLLGLGLIALTAGAAVLYSGVYSVAATKPHYAPVYAVLEVAMRRSIKHHARAVEVPPLSAPGMADRGMLLYQRHCVQCHGAPGIAPESFALALLPPPANLAFTAREWPPAELYWVIRNGIKMSGMPAWEYRLAGDDLWAIVAFLQWLPTVSPLEYEARLHEWQLTARESPVPDAPRQPASPEPGGAIATVSVMDPLGNPRRGKAAIEQYACATCHRIPGVAGSGAPVGPPLAKVATRATIAGFLPNTPSNMVRWLREPRRINPRSAMPDLGVDEPTARDMAAYLYTLR